MKDRCRAPLIAYFLQQRAGLPASALCPGEETDVYSRSITIPPPDIARHARV